jgi:antitoxin CcdA
MPPRSLTAPSKRTVSVSVRSNLLAAARRARVNLSAPLERAVTQEPATAKRGKWPEENRQAIEAYNEHVEMHGVF